MWQKFNMFIFLCYLNNAGLHKSHSFNDFLEKNYNSVFFFFYNFKCNISLFLKKYHILGTSIYDVFKKVINMNN